MDHQVQGEAGAHGGQVEGEDVSREREPNGLRRGELEPAIDHVRLSDFRMARQQPRGGALFMFTRYKCKKIIETSLLR